MNAGSRNLIAEEWAEAHAIFDPCEEGNCVTCGKLADIDSGKCEECHEKGNPEPY